MNKTMQEPSKAKRNTIRCISFFISCFFISSALGYPVVIYMLKTGRLSKETIEFSQSLNIIDHIIRVGQIILVVVASITMMLSRKITVKLFFINFTFSFAAFAINDKWGLSFLPLVITTTAFVYAYLIYKLGYLK
jgi:hypothetical protein